MDNDLYRIVSLALSGLIVLALLGIASALGRIRKALEARPEARAPERSDKAAKATTSEDEKEEDEVALLSEPAAETEVGDLGPAPLRQPEPSLGATPVEPDGTSEPEPSWGGAAAGAGTSPSISEPQPTTETPAWDKEEERFAAQYHPPAKTEEPPGATSPLEDSPFATPAPSAAEPAVEPDLSGAGLGAEPAAEAQEPAAEAQPATQAPASDQPFEKDGRWFFRRGDELLVYEESTGQWLPADHVTSTVMAATAEASRQEEATEQLDRADLAAAGEPESETPDPLESTTPQPAASGGFWKCPSCGAVNGSTAGTCRMCFTARP